MGWDGSASSSWPEHALFLNSYGQPGEGGAEGRGFGGEVGRERTEVI